MIVHNLIWFFDDDFHVCDPQCTPQQEHVKIRPRQ